jgi:hypothetical protein
VWGCGVVRQFWGMVEKIFSNFYPNFILGRKEAIFGHSGSEGDSVFNTILILSRYFIWKSKFTTKHLDEVDFINYLKGHLELIYFSKRNYEKQAKFIENWSLILDHFQVGV